MTEKVVATFEPVKYRVQKASGTGWVLVGDFETQAKAEARARDLAQFYGFKSRVLELPK